MKKGRLTIDQQGNLIVGLLALAVVLASVVLTPSDAAVSLFGWTVPPLCLWKQMTGMDCLGCGLTRSFTYMGHGQVAAAFGKHMAGPLLYTLVAAQIPLRGWRLLRSLRKRDGVGVEGLGAVPSRD